MPALRSAPLLAIATALGVLTTTVPAHAGAEADVTTRRIAGADRYATAAALARTACGQNGTLALARGDAFPDALAAVNLGSPVVLTPFAGLPAPTRELLQQCRPYAVDVLGTTDVVSTRVSGQVDEVVPEVRRVLGRDRYATAAAARSSSYNFEAEIPRVVDGLRTAFLTSGVQVADALSAGPVAHRERLPLLLTAPDRLPAATRAALLAENGSSTDLEQVVVVGGVSAVSAQVVREVEALGLRVRRISGADRQRTAIAVFEFAEQEFGWELEHVNLTRGDGFADAVAGAPHAGRERAPILLTAGVGDLGSATRDFLRSRARTITSIDVFGDRTAVSDAVVADADDAATG